LRHTCDFHYCSIYKIDLLLGNALTAEVQATLYATVLLALVCTAAEDTISSNIFEVVLPMTYVDR